MSCFRRLRELDANHAKIPGLQMIIRDARFFDRPEVKLELEGRFLPIPQSGL